MEDRRGMIDEGRQKGEGWRPGTSVQHPSSSFHPPVSDFRASLRRMRYLMGCFVEIEAEGDERKRLTAAVEAAFAEMKRIERLLSRFLVESAVFRVNAEAGRVPVAVPAEVFELFETCRHYGEKTGGAFDITTGVLTELWARAVRRGRKPASREIEATLKGVGFGHVRLDRGKRTVFFERPGMRVDFGGIGKGYAVDRAVAVLKNQGIQKGLVTTESTVYAWGEHERGFGVRNPLAPGEILAGIPLQDQAVSTSGAYERFFKIKGRVYGHHMDPRTGFPVRGDLLSVSITTPSAMQSDILSTAFFVLGKNRGPRLIRNIGNARMTLITRKRFWPGPEVIPAEAAA